MQFKQLKLEEQQLLPKKDQSTLRSNCLLFLIFLKVYLYLILLKYQLSTNPDVSKTNNLLA